MTASTKNTIWAILGVLLIIGLVYYFWPKAVPPSTSSGRYIPNTGGGFSSPVVVSSLTKQDADTECRSRGFSQSVQHNTLDGKTYFTCTNEPSRLYAQVNPLLYYNSNPVIGSGYNGMPPAATFVG